MRSSVDWADLWPLPHRGCQARRAVRLQPQRQFVGRLARHRRQRYSPPVCRRDTGWAAALGHQLPVHPRCEQRPAGALHTQGHRAEAVVPRPTGGGGPGQLALHHDARGYRPVCTIQAAQPLSWLPEDEYVPTCRRWLVPCGRRARLEVLPRCVWRRRRRQNGSLRHGHYRAFTRVRSCQYLCLRRSRSCGV